MNDIVNLDDETNDVKDMVRDQILNVDNTNPSYVTYDGDRVVVQLEFPFTTTFRVNGGTERTETTDRVSFRRPNGGDFRAMQSFTNDTDRTVQMFLRLSGLTQAQFDKIALSDIQFCNNVIENFSKGNRLTGKI